MSDSEYRYPAGSDTPISRDTQSAPQAASPGDQKSVPDGPARPKGQTRPMGPGSVAGTLCADPEIRFTGTGKAMVKLRVAVSQRVKEETSGTWIDGPTTYVDVTVWGRQGEHAADELRKGDRVVGTGMWQEERWYGRDDQWHTKTSLTAREIGPSLMFKGARVIRDQEGSQTQ